MSRPHYCLAAAAPKATDVTMAVPLPAVKKWWPVMVTLVPPVVGPVEGDTVVIKAFGGA